MQNRYAGDIGDFGKFALLRQLSPGLRVGVCWYFVEDETGSNDGRHRDYLSRPRKFRQLDEETFDGLLSLVDEPAERSVATLERLNLLRDAVFHGVPVPRGSSQRREWFAGVRKTLQQCQLVFLDPDNGLARGAVTHKCVDLDEVAALISDGQSVLVYHHQTRMKGGAVVENRYLTDGLLKRGARRVQAIRMRPYSSRFYFLVNGTDDLYDRFGRFARQWGNRIVIFDAVSA